MKKLLLILTKNTTMKRVLLILLCVPMIGFGQQNKDCDSDPDYIMTAEDFIRTIENEKNNKKYDGKVFQFSIKWGYPDEEMDFFKSYQEYGNTYYGSALLFFNGKEIPGLVDFNFDNFSKDEYRYCEKLTEASKKNDWNGATITIKGRYSYEESELKKENYKEGKYQLINCCYVIPNK